MNKIGIIGAMEIELETLKSHMQITNTLEKASMSFLEGTLNHTPVVVVKSGIGKVNAGMCVQILVDIFHVTHIINTGIAGSLNAVIDIGDIVLSTDALYHDVDATGFGYPLGVIPQMEQSVFRGDERLISLARECCAAVVPEIGVHVGRVVSGDQFVSDKAKTAWLTENFDGFCTEMEGAAIAQTAWLNQVPFLIIRAISDKADDSAEMDYEVFEKQAIEHSVKLVKALLEKMD